MRTCVTRFPPSPTGHLHIGGARTALFNWLLARGSGGRFLLRLEDTDVARSSRTMTESIFEALQWLGLDWDDEPCFQSERFELYRRHLSRLLETGQAYYCRCSEEEVEAMRQEAWARGEKPKYNGKCRELGLGPDEGRVVRFKSPRGGETTFQDALRGGNAVDNRELDDFVLQRADGTPTYNLAVVVDDAAMGITHILRGDDHLSNTPKQVLLYEALGFELPLFCHVPMILGPDKKRLSKRHGAMSVLQYRDRGYLPQALINYLVRLGWSYGDQEIFEVSELVEKFSLDNLGQSACVFNPEKLDWVNSQHIKREDPARLAGLLQRFLADKGLGEQETAYLERIVPLLQPRAGTMEEMAEMAAFFVIPDEELRYEPEQLRKYLGPEVRTHLDAIRRRLRRLEDFSQAALEGELRTYLEEANVKFKKVAQPIRVAITGKTASPGLFETMEVLGRERVANRLDRALREAEEAPG
jgi:glutamyl-tRNA synthetase